MACSAEYKHLSTSTFKTCQMSGQQQLSNSYKRRPKEQHPLQQDQTSQPQLKRQRLSYHSPGSSPRPEFWDNLSKIWLTKSALKELDRRNTQSVPNPPSPYQQVHQPVTQHFFANLKPIESVDDFLRNCSLRTSKDIKLFSRHGGPDLSGLRGVCAIETPIVDAGADNATSIRNLSTLWTPLRTQDRQYLIAIWIRRLDQDPDVLSRRTPPQRKPRTVGPRMITINRSLLTLASYLIGMYIRTVEDRHCPSTWRRLNEDWLNVNPHFRLLRSQRKNMKNLDKRMK